MGRIHVYLSGFRARSFISGEMEAYGQDVSSV